MANSEAIKQLEDSRDNFLADAKTLIDKANALNVAIEILKGQVKSINSVLTSSIVGTARVGSVVKDVPKPKIGTVLQRVEQIIINAGRFLTVKEILKIAEDAGKPFKGSIVSTISADKFPKSTINVIKRGSNKAYWGLNEWIVKGDIPEDRLPYDELHHQQPLLAI